MKKLLLLFALVTAASCWRDLGICPEKTRKVRVSMELDCTLLPQKTRSEASDLVATDLEKQINDLTLYTFDETTGVLESMAEHVDCSGATTADKVIKLATVEVEAVRGSGNAKRYFAVANQDFKFTPQVGVTTLDQMLSATISCAPHDSRGGHAAGCYTLAPYQMTAVTGSSDQDVTLTMTRLVARIILCNDSADQGLVIESVEPLQAPDAAQAFEGETPRADFTPVYADQTPLRWDGSNDRLKIDLLPHYHDVLPTVLRVKGTIAGTAFERDLNLQTLLSKLQANHVAYIHLTAAVPARKIDVRAEHWMDWDAGKEVTIDLTGGRMLNQTWATRNVGATSDDYANDWWNSIGAFFQFGRATAFPYNGGYTVTTGPLAADRDPMATTDFLALSNTGDPSDYWEGGYGLREADKRWQESNMAPCPTGYRVPVDKDYEAILPIGISFGNSSSNDDYRVDGNRITGIKDRGTKNAYYMVWVMSKVFDNPGDPASNHYVLEVYHPSKKVTDGVFPDFTDKELAVSEHLRFPVAGLISTQGDYLRGYASSDPEPVRRSAYWTHTTENLIIPGKDMHGSYSPTAMHIWSTAVYKSYGRYADGYSMRCIKM